MEWSSIGWISYGVLWTIVLIQVVLTLALARFIGQLSRRFPASGARVIDPGPEIGDLVENWQGVDLLGRSVGFQFPRERGVLLLYMSPHCTTCAALLPAAKSFLREVGADVEGVWVMVLGRQQTQIRYAEEHGLALHPVVSEEQLPRSWQVQGSPFGLWINAAGRVVTKGMVNHREHLESLRYAAETGYASMESYMTAKAEAEQMERELL